MTTVSPAIPYSRAISERGYFVRRERPTALGLLALVLAFLIPVSLIPSERGEFITIPGLPALWWSTVLLFVFALVGLGFRWFGGFSHPISRATRRYLLIPFFLLTGWQIVSLSWNGRPFESRSYSIVESMGMLASIAGAGLLTSGLAARSQWNFGKGLALFVVCVSLLYAGLSFVFPSFRPSSAWMDRTTTTLGFVRIFGPLGVATTLNFVLLPALGFSLGAFLSPGWSRVYWGCIAAPLALTIIGTGSRGGILCLIAFAAILLLASGFRAALAIFLIGSLVGASALAYGVPERFRNFEDEGRLLTYQTAWRAFTGSPRNIVLGAGHGALYTKLEVDATRRLRGKSRWYLASEQTLYGNTLRSSHSAILRSLAETGPLGLGLLIIPLCWVSYRAISRRYHRPRVPGNLVARSTLAGCAAVIPYMALEEFFIAAFWPVVIWTMFVVVAAEMLDNSSGHGLRGG